MIINGIIGANIAGNKPVPRAIVDGNIPINNAPRAPTKKTAKLRPHSRLARSQTVNAPQSMARQSPQLKGLEI